MALRHSLAPTMGPVAHVLALASLALVSLASCAIPRADADKPKPTFEVTKSEAEWKKQLSAPAYDVIREKGTERAFSGAYWNHHEAGVYRCAACGRPLFSSDHKYDSGTGWPSYYQPIDAKAVLAERDDAYGMSRTEVMCSRCGAHLGHVFDDGPKPTGLRYCINSISLAFVPTSTAAHP